MNSLDANTRDSKSKGDVRSLRLAGNIPGIVYGGLIYASDAADDPLTYQSQLSSFP